MKTFILENIYMSDMSAPSVYSTDRFPTFESAIEEAYKQFKEEAKTYRKSYGADKITTEECYRGLYIKVPISRIGGQSLRSRLPRRRTNEHTKLYRSTL